MSGGVGIEGVVEAGEIMRVVIVADQCDSSTLRGGPRRADAGLPPTSLDLCGSPGNRRDASRRAG